MRVSWPSKPNKRDTELGGRLVVVPGPPRAGATVVPERGDDMGAAAGAPSSVMRDQFLGALTEILRTAANQEDSHDMASTLRELAAAAEALADTLERERDGS